MVFLRLFKMFFEKNRIKKEKNKFLSGFYSTFWERRKNDLANLLFWSRIC